MIAWLLAAQLAVVANAPDTAASCAPFEVTVAARAAGGVAPRVAFPASSAFEVLRATSQSHVEQDGAGHPFGVTEGTFLVTTHNTGRVSLAGITASAGATRAVATPIAMTVHEGSNDPDDPQVLVRARLDDGRSIGERDSLFVGQQVDYVLEVQLNEAARRRLRRNPTFFPPDMPAVLAYDVEPPNAVPRGGVHCFESLTYRRALFPLFAGRTVIPPATLSYAIPVSTSFFSREESHELRTDSVEVIAVDPPLAGRPADYAGAIGTMTASAKVGAPTARMGDPVVLTVRVEGTGNVKLFPRPAIAVPWATIATGEERVVVDTSHAKVSGAKEFDWLLTPTHAGHQTVGAIRYPHFDPERAAYAVDSTAPISLEVAVADLASADTVVAVRPPIRTAMRDERAPLLPDRPMFWLLLAVAPVPATLRRVRRIRSRGARGVSASQRLVRASERGGPVVARELRRLYLDALQARIPALVPATARTPLARQLRRAGVTEATAAAAETLLDALDTAAFSGGGALAAGVSAEAARLFRAVDDEAVRPRGAMRTLSLLLIIGLGAGAALHALPSGAAGTFTAGVRAYNAGSVVLAERQFAHAAQLAPRAPDAWANLGTAALAAGDTARAAAGWQRALRLEPLDAESRDRLDALHPAQSMSSRGYVAPVPVDAVAIAVLVLWIGAWLALALPPTRVPTAVKPIATGTLAVAILALLATLQLKERLDARGLGVLRTSLALSESPEPGAADTGTGGVGEVGRIGASEGPWVRVTLDGTRAGWVPTSAILPLDEAAGN